MYIFCNEEPLWMSLCLKEGSALLEYKGSWKNTTLQRYVYKTCLYIFAFSAIFQWLSIFWMSIIGMKQYMEVKHLIGSHCILMVMVFILGPNVNQGNCLG